MTDILHRLELEFPIISSPFKRYSSDGIINGILNGLDKAIKDEDLDSIKFYIHEMDDWYSDSIDGIMSNEFVFNKSDHERNKTRVSELRQKLDEEISDYVETKPKKGSVLYTAFDEFRLIRPIGQGGNGTVFEAVDSMEEHVAIKIVDMYELSKDKKRRFKNEINTCQKTKHPNIIEVTDAGSTDSGRYAFYVMPLYQKTLRNKIREGIQPQDAIEIFDSLLTGLAYAHDKGIYHRDIKPENILFSENSNQCVIADFGIAHIPVEEMVTTVETKIGDRMANFQYAAPEQKNKEASVDGRADVFAAGLILNEMLTGQLIGSSGYRKIGEVYPEYSFLDAIVEQLYRQDPNDRLYPPSRICQELHARIEMAKNEEQVQHLSESLKDAERSNEEYKEFSVPSLVGARVDNGKLILKLDSEVPSRWYDVFRSGAYGHTASWNYEPGAFMKNGKDELAVKLRSIDNQRTIKDIVTYFKQWLPIVTDIYNNQRKSEIERRKREQIDRIKREKKRIKN